VTASFEIHPKWRALARCNIRALVLAALIVTPQRSPAQTWRTVLTAAAEAALWVDYCQIRYGLSRGSPTWVLGQQLSPTSVSIVNGSEMLVNAAAPRRWRPLINAVTLVGHVLGIYHSARRPLELPEPPAGEKVSRIGVRFWW
jgi:hypothetical protein